MRHAAIDETSRAKGHEYVTAVADTERRRLVFLAEGRKSSAVREFAEYLARHGGDAERISRATIDMSAAFIKGVRERLPNAEPTHDKFHIVAPLPLGDSLPDCHDCPWVAFSFLG